MKNLQLKLIPLLFLTNSCLYANSINAHILGGNGWAQIHHTDNLYLNSFVENSYETSKDTNSPLIGLGGSYQFDNLFPNNSQLLLDLGASALYTKYKLSGVNSPFSNGGEFDTLTYHATDKTFALLFESKLIYNCYYLQPYILVGLGVAWNKAYGYSEETSDKSSSAVTLSAPFGNETNSQFAYEFGLGMQTLIYKFKHNHNLNLFLDYRYLNLGTIQLGSSSLQATSQGLDMGTLKTQLISIGLQYQIC